MSDSPLPRPSYDELAALVERQAEQIAAMTVEIAELRRRLGMDSSNSSKPPSSDGLKKTGRSSSGVVGHEEAGQAAWGTGGDQDAGR